MVRNFKIALKMAVFALGFKKCPVTTLLCSFKKSCFSQKLFRNAHISRLVQSELRNFLAFNWLMYHRFANVRMCYSSITIPCFLFSFNKCAPKRIWEKQLFSKLFLNSKPLMPSKITTIFSHSNVFNAVLFNQGFPIQPMVLQVYNLELGSSKLN